jgi:hypothetical protein
MERVDELGQQGLRAVEESERGQSGREQSNGEPAVLRISGQVPGLTSNGLVHVSTVARLG